MMRWLFAALVLANLGLLMWASWYRDTPGESLQPRPVYHPELMVALNTPGVSLRTRRNERAEAPLAAAKPRPRCVSAGPFGPDSTDRSAAWFAQEKLETSRRTEERRLENSYWVHLSPFANRKAAERRMKELEKLGIRDLLIMQDPQGQLAISLGLFSQADNAKHRLQELAQKGVEAKQETRYRSEVLTWFELQLPEPADAAVGRLRGRDWGATGVEISDAPCPVEAPAAPSDSASAPLPG